MGLPEHERLRLLEAATGRRRAALAADPRLSPAERERFDALAARRTAGEPLQYLEGSIPFGPVEVSVDRRALIPRPETEQLFELAVAALEDAGPGTVIVDLCTGSGALALALKHAFPAARVFGTDIDPGALALASSNAAAAGLEVTLLEGDLFAALPERLRGRIDLLVANPPYVSEAEWDALPAEVRDHEPRRALVAGPSGTEVVERIAEEAYWWLGVGGYTICEIGETQGERALEAFGAFDRAIRHDLNGRDRFVVARKGASCCV
jgi:release factor glutamine methyltransferase